MPVQSLSHEKREQPTQPSVDTELAQLDKKVAENEAKNKAKNAENPAKQIEINTTTKKTQKETAGLQQEVYAKTFSIYKSSPLYESLEKKYSPEEIESMFQQIDTLSSHLIELYFDKASDSSLSTMHHRIIQHSFVVALMDSISKGQSADNELWNSLLENIIPSGDEEQGDSNQDGEDGPSMLQIFGGMMSRIGQNPDLERVQSRLKALATYYVGQEESGVFLSHDAQDYIDYFTSSTQEDAIQTKEKIFLTEKSDEEIDEKEVYEVFQEYATGQNALTTKDAEALAALGNKDFVDRVVSAESNRESMIDMYGGLFDMVGLLGYSSPKGFLDDVGLLGTCNTLLAWFGFPNGLDEIHKQHLISDLSTLSEKQKTVLANMQAFQGPWFGNELKDLPEEEKSFVRSCIPGAELSGVDKSQLLDYMPTNAEDVRAIVREGRVDDTVPAVEIVEKVLGSEYITQSGDGTDKVVDREKWSQDGVNLFVQQYFSNNLLPKHIQQCIVQHGTSLSSSADVLVGIIAPVFHTRALEDDEVLTDILAASQASVSLSPPSQGSEASENTNNDQEDTEEDDGESSIEQTAVTRSVGEGLPIGEISYDKEKIEQLRDQNERPNKFVSNGNYLSYLLALERKYGLPAGMLIGVAYVENGLTINGVKHPSPTVSVATADQRSAADARGMFQFVMKTASGGYAETPAGRAASWRQHGEYGYVERLNKKYNIDPPLTPEEGVINPVYAAEAAAMLLHNVHKNSGRDIRRAILHYHGGGDYYNKHKGKAIEDLPDTGNSKTRQYVQMVNSFIRAFSDNDLENIPTNLRKELPKYVRKTYNTVLSFQKERSNVAGVSQSGEALSLREAPAGYIAASTPAQMAMIGTSTVEGLGGYVDDWGVVQGYGGGSAEKVRSKIENMLPSLVDQGVQSLMVVAGTNNTHSSEKSTQRVLQTMKQSYQLLIDKGIQPVVCIQPQPTAESNKESHKNFPAFQDGLRKLAATMRFQGKSLPVIDISQVPLKSDGLHPADYKTVSKDITQALGFSDNAMAV